MKKKSLQTRTGARPFVLVNMAMTADGKIATANRTLSTFGSARDHEHLLELRATADAVIAGARTVDSAQVNLGPGGKKHRRARTQRGLDEFNLRIIVSRTGSIDPRAEIFRHNFSPILILTTRRAGTKRLERLQQIAHEVKVCGDTEIDFAEAFRWLRKDWGVRRLLCEGGGELNDALFRADLVDELHLTICPILFGGDRSPTIADGSGAASLAEATALVLKSRRRIGDELFLRFARR